MKAGVGRSAESVAAGRAASVAATLPGDRIGACVECGYSFAGLRDAAGRCPECGWEYDERTHVWTRRRTRFQRWAPLLDTAPMFVIVVAMWIWHGFPPGAVFGIALIPLIGMLIPELYFVVRRRGIEGPRVVAGFEGLELRMVEPPIARTWRWDDLERARVTDRFLHFSAAVKPRKGWEVDVTGVFSTAAEVQRFVEVVNERIEAARGVADGDAGPNARA